MLQKSSLRKMMMRLLLAGTLLMVCTTGAFAYAATVNYNPASGSSITAGTPISATVSGVPANALVSIAVTASGTTATSYGVPSFSMPFQLDSSTFTVSGSNVNTISLSVAAPDGTHSVTNHGLGTLLSGYTAQAGTYNNNGASITPITAGQPSSVTVTLAGTAHSDISGSTLTWDTTGATVGSTITMTIAGQSATYTIVAPAPEPNPDNIGGSGDGAPSTAGAQKGVVQQQQQQSTATSTVSVQGTGSENSGTLSAGSVEGMTGATTSWSVTSTSQPTSGATITTSITQTPPAATLAAFQSTYQVQGLGISAVAYTMTVTKNGVTSTGPATITMTVPLSWVQSHGGVNAISIVRQADDGTVTTLEATPSIDPTTGMVTYTAVSPNGLCVFALVAVSTSTPVVGNTTVTTTATPAVTPVVSLAATTAPTAVPTTLTAPAKATAANDPLASFFAPLLNLLNLG